MASDDTGTPGNGNWEINLVFDGDISKESNAFELPLLDINYGIGERLQLKYEVPFVVTRNPTFDKTGRRTTEKSSGFSNSRVGVKYRFFDNEQAGLSLAVYHGLHSTHLVPNWKANLTKAVKVAWRKKA